MKQALIDIGEERHRQLTSEGFDDKHDDQYKRDELVDAAIAYLQYGYPTCTVVPPFWPWDSGWWKPKDRRSSLIKAAALIAAEIDRLDRNET